MENKNFDNKQLSNIKAQRNVFIVLTIIFALATVFSIYKLLNSEKTVERVMIEKEGVNAEKVELISKLEKINAEYSKLSDEYKGLDSVFLAEKAHIEKLLKDLKTKNGDIAKYKAKVANYEQRFKEYVAQIEELKKKNVVLTQQNLVIKTALDSTVIENTQLSKDKEVLTSKVEAGSILKAYDITVEALKVKGNGQEMPTNKVKRVEKIRTCFILSENAIAKAGKKVIYVRISEPDGTIISESTDQAHEFDYQGKKILFTEKQEINYANKAMDLCIYWAKPRTYKPGVYYADIFVDGINIGTSSISLEK